jgi:hypothetical protein
MNQKVKRTHHSLIESTGSQMSGYCGFNHKLTSMVGAIPIGDATGKFNKLFPLHEE